jgi:hypothetical protein
LKVEVSRFGSLPEAIEDALAVIDRAASDASVQRLPPGLVAISEAAMREADRFQQGRPGSYPFLEAAVDAGEAADLAESAAKVLAEQAAFETIGAALRRLRLQARREVQMATTPAEVIQRRDQAVAEIAAL